MYAFRVEGTQRYKEALRLMSLSLVLWFCFQPAAASAAEPALTRIDQILEWSAAVAHTQTGVIAMIVVIPLLTFLSEDLTCIAAGIAASEGVLHVVLAMALCFFGLWAGDVLLYLAGYYVGGAVVQKKPFKWLISAPSLEAASSWFDRYGPAAILLSRMVPGARLPTYVSAGVLRAPARMCVFYFFLAAAIWAPLLVGLAMWLGDVLLPIARSYERFAALALLAVAGFLWLLIHGVLPLFNFRGRRLLTGKIKACLRWEFWPPWLFYFPVVLYVGGLMIKYRSLTLFTASNPAIATGGFVGESKGAILEGLSEASSHLARFTVVPAHEDDDQRMELIRHFLSVEKLSYPIVLKPDVGQRGKGVSIINNDAEAQHYLSLNRCDSVIQEYLEGREFGIAYYRYPADTHGHVFSITRKVLPELEGDGAHTLEELILSDSRAVCMAPLYLKINADRLSAVPAAGEKIKLTQLGNHCRGAVFLKGDECRTMELEASIDRISQRFAGFFIGRYDVIAESDEALKRGAFKIIELNGVTGESTDIYDPANSLWLAQRKLMQQWHIAFEIGNQNRWRGVAPTPPLQLLRLLALCRT